MSHNELAKYFQKSAICAKSYCPKDLSYEQVCRIIYGRLYYALYHKYLEYDVELSNSKERSKHITILNTIRDKYNLQTYQIYKKIQNLRIWADYSFEKHPSPGANVALMKIDVLIMQINQIIKKEKFE